MSLPISFVPCELPFFFLEHPVSVQLQKLQVFPCFGPTIALNHLCCLPPISGENLSLNVVPSVDYVDLLQSDGLQWANKNLWTNQ